MSTISFETKVTKINDWTLVTIPAKASTTLPSRGMVLVKGKVNGAPFVTALEPDGNGSHWLNINKDLLKTSKAKAGDMVKIEMEASKDWPEPEIPTDIQKGLEADKEAYAIWKSVTPMARWDWIRWIRATNNPATRANHIIVACSKLKHGIRRPCCFNRQMCTVPEVSKSGVLITSQ